MRDGVRRPIAAARLTAKQHRFELAAVVAISAVVVVAAGWAAVSLETLGVSEACFASWQGVAAADPSCSSVLAKFGELDEELAQPVLAMMAVLPFVAGLLAGAPIVARELEARTAQTAWWLEPARLRWLARQSVPLLMLLLLAVGLAAAASSALQATREPYAPASAETLTLFGWPVVARGVAAFAVGLFVGSVLGRALPALITGAALCLVLYVATGSLQAQWTREQVKPVMDDSGWHGHSYGVAFVAADGRTLSEAAAVALAPGDSQNPYDWLGQHHYDEVELGVSDADALGWIPIDVALYGFVAASLIISTAATVQRRRPQ